MKTLKKLSINLFLLLVIVTLLVVGYKFLHNQIMYEKDIKENYYILISNQVLNQINLAFPLRTEITDKQIYEDQIVITKKQKKEFPAILKTSNGNKKIEIRPRGLFANHWIREKKSWLLRFGNQDIKLYIPEDRGYFIDVFSQYRAKKMNLLYPQHIMKKLYINDEYEGAYLQIEDFNKSFIETKKRTSDSPIYISESGCPIFDDIMYWQTHNESNHYQPLYELLKLLKEEETPFKDINQIIDLQSFYAWNVLNLLNNSCHQNDWGNMALYFNNTKGKFEFIAQDVHIYPVNGDAIKECEDNSLVRKLLSYPKILEKRNQFLKEYLIHNYEIDFKKQKEINTKLHNYLNDDPKKRDSNQRIGEILKSQEHLTKVIYENLSIRPPNEQSDYIPKKFDLSFSTPIQEIYASGEIRSNSLDIKIHNPTKKNINIKKIKFDNLFDTSHDHQFNLNELPYDKINWKKKHIDIDDLNLKPQSIINISITSDYQLQLKLDSTLEMVYEGFGRDNNRSINLYQTHINTEYKKINEKNIILSGDLQFEQTTIYDEDSNIIIKPGTHIKLNPSKSIVFRGKVTAQGKKDNPIIIESKEPNKPFGTIALVNSNANGSSLDYVIIRNGSESRINNIYFSGMFSAYNVNDIKISNSKIMNSFSDDGLNFKYSNGIVTNTEFVNNSADAIDFDFMSGRIDNCIFKNNGNDSIDLSGSTTLIQNNTILKSGDKCISVGENSHPIIYNNILDGCNIGIESKDSSKPIVVHNILRNNKVALNAYQKKEFFSGSRLEVYNSIFKANESIAKTENTFAGEQLESDDSTVEIYNSKIDNAEYILINKTHSQPIHSLHNINIIGLINEKKL